METEKTPTHEESLAIILSMTKAAQKSFQNNSFYFLLWGWLVLVAGLAQYVLIEYLHYEHSDRVWLLMPLGGIISFIYGYKQNKDSQVKSLIDSYVGHVWIAFVVMLVLVLANYDKLGWTNVYGILIALYGLGSFITGGIIRFAPLKWGGALCWPIAYLTFQIDSSAILLLLTLAILVGYIIPGHLLRKKEIEQDV